MCGITGFYATQEAATKVRIALTAMASRGKETAGIYDGMISIRDTPADLPYSGSEDAMGHVLHAMVGCLPQPLASPKNNVLTANCEIYNWKALARAHGFTAINDTDVLLQLLDAGPTVLTALEQLDGVYAFAYETDAAVVLARDLLGVKPLFYSVERGFAFASERKALESQGYTMVRELYPRTVLTYHKKNKTVSELQRPFFEIAPEHTDSYEAQRDAVKNLLLQAVRKRIPDAHAPYGLLLSGGVDSSTIARILKDAGETPRCYVVGEADSPDVLAAKRVAATLGLPLTILSPAPEELAAALPAIIAAIEDANPVKVSVAATFWFACAQAEKDGMRAVFSGLGSEELFAGYERHRRSTAVNKECLAGLRKLHERDLYRDDVITMHHGIELRLPFLDKALVHFALKVPAEHKLDESDGQRIDKWILRDAALELGVSEETAFRPKKAAQYGSRIMKQLEKLAKGHDTVADYLNTMRGKPNRRLAALLSTGKDSVLALHIMHRMRYEISCLVTIESKNADSYMFHTPNVSLAALQAEALRMPLLTQQTPGEKEEELSALTEALRAAKEKYAIEGVVTGALASQYQRERIENVCDALGLTVFTPLWQMDQVQELHMLLANDFEVVIAKVAADGLDSTWLGQTLDDAMIDRLVALRASHGVHPAAEGGEYESLVLDAPLFTKRLRIVRSEIIKDGAAATLNILQAELVDK